MTKIKGVITALVTPFKDGKVDLNSFRRLVRAQAEQVDGFVVNGTTGESPTLTYEDVKSLYEAARGETRLPVIVGTGSNSTAKTIELTRKVSEWKPDAVLVVVPYYNKPPQRGLKAHFEEVAKSSSAPVILYNVPGRTITSLEAKTAGQLSRAANITGIKDATADMSVLAQLQAEVREGFALLSGDDGTCIDFCARGGHGVIAVASHVIGREMKEAVAKAWSGDAKINAEYTRKYAGLMKWLYCEANPIPVKAAVKMMGLIDSAEMRLPLVELDTPFQKELESCLKELGKV